jgi:hypothetical protein
MKIVFLFALLCISLLCGAQCDQDKEQLPDKTEHVTAIFDANGLIVQETFEQQFTRYGLSPETIQQMVNNRNNRNSSPEVDFAYLRGIPTYETIEAIKPITRYRQQYVDKPIYMSVTLNRSGNFSYGNILSISGGRIKQIPYSITTTRYGSYLTMASYD